MSQKQTSAPEKQNLPKEKSDRPGSPPSAQMYGASELMGWLV